MTVATKVVGNKLDRVIVSGFKSIKSMNLPLRDLNVLIGANGSGKSNFIGVFKLLNRIVEDNLQLYVAQSGGANTFLRFGQKVTDKIEIRLSFGMNRYLAELIATTDDSLIFGNERCTYRPTHEVQLGIGNKETGLIKEAAKRPGNIASYVLESLKSWKLYHFHDTSDTANVKQTRDIGDSALLKPDAANLAAFLYALQKDYYEYYVRIVETIRLAVPFFDDFVFQPGGRNQDTIQLRWREKGHPDVSFNANSLSDGSLRFICLATLLLQPPEKLPSTILIDEPELGLHPYAIVLLASMLKAAATETQVIVSTQSVPLVNQFVPEDIIVVDRKEDQSKFKRLTEKDVENWLGEFGLGDLWEKNVIGGEPQW